jgi:hypothetical protein
MYLKIAVLEYGCWASGREERVWLVDCQGETAFEITYPTDACVKHFPSALCRKTIQEKNFVKSRDDIWCPCR